jgi:hypothetical protein
LKKKGGEREKENVKVFLSVNKRGGMLLPKLFFSINIQKN